MKPIEDSELILNGDGTVFHLHLLPENIADNIILVGDQDRTDVVAQNFDTIDFKVQNREFKTITGTKKRETYLGGFHWHRHRQYRHCAHRTRRSS